MIIKIIDDLNSDQSKYEYDKRTKRARKLLFASEVYPGMYNLSTYQKIMQLWCNDSLGDFCSWTLFHLEDDYRLRKVIWKQRFEYRLSTPLTHAADSILTVGIVNTVVSLFEELLIDETNVNRRVITIDGIRYGLNYFKKK